jgi:hypothetical protein
LKLLERHQRASLESFRLPSGQLQYAPANSFFTGYTQADSSLEFCF